MIRKFIKAFAVPLAAFAATPSAQAQDITDVSEEEFSALVRFALPAAFPRVQSVCSRVLPADSYMFANGDELQARFDEASVGSFAGARDVIVKLGASENPGLADMITQMPPEVLEPFMAEIIAGKLAQELKPDICEPANRVMELLDPLPAQNLADLVGYLVIFVANEDKKKEAAANNG